MRIARIQLADEQHDASALGQDLSDQPTCLTAGGAIIGADVTGAVALRRITVLSYDNRLLGSLIDQLRLIVGINGADSQSTDTFGQQVIDNALLLSSSPICRNLELHVHISEFTVGLFDPFARNRPEVGGIVSDEG